MPLQHTNSRYEQELLTLRSTLLRMGELVSNQIGDAVQCLFDFSTEPHFLVRCRLAITAVLDVVSGLEVFERFL